MQCAARDSLRMPSAGPYESSVWRLCKVPCAEFGGLRLKVESLSRGLSKTQLVGPQVSPPRSVSVRREPVGLMLVGVVRSVASEEKSPRGRPLSLYGHQGRHGRCGRARTRRDGGPRGAGGLMEMGRVLGGGVGGI